MTEEKVEKEICINTKQEDAKMIVLYNDDINSFMWVIQCLVDVCGHDVVQAEQCALIVHNKGKCSIKTGDYDELKLLKDELIRRQLSATIE